MDATPPPASPLDAYSPAEIARRVEAAGVAKARLPTLQTVTLGLLAGAFIGFGAMFYAVAISGSTLGFGPTRLLGGVAFSLGLVLVVVAGAELFTGNNLIAIAWAEGRITLTQLLRNWTLVFLANFMGAAATALIMHRSGAMDIGGGLVRDTILAIAADKIALGPVEAFLRGLLCNALVCLAVWLCMGAHDVASKILAVVFPIAGFVALGFEHSVANMFLIPLAILEQAPGAGWGGFAANLAPVTLGNVVGGSGFVAIVYWIVYLRRP